MIINFGRILNFQFSIIHFPFLQRAASFAVVLAAGLGFRGGVFFKGAAGGVDGQLGQAGGLAQLGVAPGLGVAHVQVDAGNEACGPRLGRLGSLRGDAYGEEAQVAQADAFAVEHQLFQAGEHVDEDTVDDAARVGRVVFRNVGDEVFEFHRAVLHGAGVPLGGSVGVLRRLGRVTSVLQCSDC